MKYFLILICVCVLQNCNKKTNLELIDKTITNFYDSNVEFNHIDVPKINNIYFNDDFILNKLQFEKKYLIKVLKVEEENDIIKSEVLINHKKFYIPFLKKNNVLVLDRKLLIELLADEPIANYQLAKDLMMNPHKNNILFIELLLLNALKSNDLNFLLKICNLYYEFAEDYLVEVSFKKQNEAFKKLAEYGHEKSRQMVMSLCNNRNAPCPNYKESSYVLSFGDSYLEAKDYNNAYLLYTEAIRQGSCLGMEKLANLFEGEYIENKNTQDSVKYWRDSSVKCQISRIKSALSQNKNR